MGREDWRQTRLKPRKERGLGLMSAAKNILAATAFLSMLAMSQPARADGDIVCNSGPRENREPISELRKANWLGGREILEVCIEGDCHEVYARTVHG